MRAGKSQVQDSRSGQKEAQCRFCIHSCSQRQDLVGIFQPTFSGTAYVTDRMGLPSAHSGHPFCLNLHSPLGSTVWGFTKLRLTKVLWLGASRAGKKCYQYRWSKAWRISNNGLNFLMSTKEGFREKKLRNHTSSVFNEDGKRGYLWHNWYLSHLKHAQGLTLEQPYPPVRGRSPKCKHPTTSQVWRESIKASVGIVLYRFHFSIYFYSTKVTHAYNSIHTDTICTCSPGTLCAAPGVSAW